MSGVIYYKTKYGATKQYAQWLSKHFGFELEDIALGPKPGSENIVVIGTNIIMGKLTANGWIKKHWSGIKDKQVVLLVIGGATVDSGDREEAICRSLPKEIIDGAKIFHLRGRFHHSDTNFLFSKMIKMAMKEEKDPMVKRDWIEGFDDVKQEYLDSIKVYISSIST